MRTTLSALAALAVLGIFGCGGKAPEPKALPAPPTIKSFTADKVRITAGDSVTLSFEAENATSAEVVSQSGEAVELTGTATSGTAAVSPLGTSVYVLNVVGEGGKASRFVQVAVDEDLDEVILVAVPSTVEAGGAAQLAWSAPHAQSARIAVGSGGELSIDAAAGSGVVEVTPDRSETYELVAEGAFSGSRTATAAITVRPVLASAEMMPAAARPGEALAFSWITRGASEVSISEKTFGEVFRTTEATDVDAGSFSWTVPTTLPNTQPVNLGLPLEFTLLVKQANPDVTLTQVFQSFVGDGPMITRFEAPAAVTVGQQLELSWATLNANRLQVLADGKLLYEPLARDQNKVASGAITLAAPLNDTTYEVIAFGHTGAFVKQTRVVQSVQAPVINEFNLPGSVANAGDPAAATWKTQHATVVTLRVADGLTVYASADAATVADGSATVRPGVRTRFVLEAWNEAGDVVREVKEVSVSSPGTFTATPSPNTPGGQVTVSWNLDAATTAQVFGDVSQLPVRNNPAIAPFNDLSLHADAQALTFVNSNDEVAQLPVSGGFTFPLAGLTASEFFVSTNGFVAFEDTGARQSNLALSSTTTLPAVIAPFWDDLNAGDAGQIYWVVDGTTFPRTLIVQWHDFETTVDPASHLTFQVQLHETGEVRFVYSTLSGTNSAGESASIGWRVDSGLNHQLGTSGAPVITAGEEAIFFNSGALTGQYTRSPQSTSVFAIVARLTSGDYVIYPGAVNVIDPSWLIINEAMVVPEGTATAGQWVELKNLTNRDLDLGGTELTTSTGSAVLPEGTTLEAGGFLVVGQSTDPLQNGGAAVDVEWSSGFAASTTADDTLTLLAGETPLASFSYTVASLTPATSLQAPDPTTLNTAGSNPTCAPTSLFGANGAKGTPGGANDTCFEYTLASIPVNYADISATGTPLFPPGSANQDQKLAEVDLSGAPLTYFGDSVATMTVVSNGFLSFTTPPSVYETNDIRPDTLPAGVVAPFWDDLDNTTGTGANVFVQRFEETELTGEPKAHWVVQWHRYTHDTSLVASEDDLNFQVKLFDDGAIEYHYDIMRSGSSSNWANGRSATVWLANPSGATALPIGTNDPVIESDTAYRFSPKP